MTTIEWLIAATVVMPLAVLIVWAIDGITARHVSIGSGVVIEKIYTAATHSTGVGFASNVKTSGPMVTSSFSPEKWTVIVKHRNETFSADVDANTWAAIEDGDEVELLEIRGRIWTWGRIIKYCETLDQTE